MNCCTILIKIKDFMPKLSKIPFNNYICIFTNNDFEGRISLMQYEYQHINHEIRDINSDINYKIKLFDIISKKIIGISEHCIKYNIINELNLGTSINFINQIRILPYTKNTSKISSKLNCCNKINLTISTEIIKFNKTPINYISKENSDFLKLNLNSSLNKNKYNKFANINIKKNETKNLNMSEKREDASFNKLNEEDKNNINLNMHNITVQNYYTINSSTPVNIKSFKNNKIYTKKYLKKINKNKINENENNYSERKNNDSLKKNKIFYSNKIYQSSTNKNNNKNDYFSSIESLDTNRSINLTKKKMILTKLKYNNNSFKVINVSRSKDNNNSVDKINNKINSYELFSVKKQKSKNKIIFVNKSLEISSYNLTYNSKSFIQRHKYNKKLESIISPKNNKLKNNCNSLKRIHIVNLKEKNNNNYSHKNNKYRKECKKNIISLIEFYILLSKKMKKLKDTYNSRKSKYLLGKENLMNIKEKKNIIEEKKEENNIKKYIYVNIHSKLNNQIISKFKIIKKKELNIFQNIFNLKLNQEDISNQLNKDISTKEEQSNKINLYIILLKNIVNHYGNISQIFNDNHEKKNKLLQLLINKGIEINRSDFLYKKNIDNKLYQEIKEELNEENEDESVIDEDKEPNEQSLKNEILGDKDKEKNYNLALNIQKNKNKMDIIVQKYSRNNKNKNEKDFQKNNKKK